jgi:hypothetical protein
VNYDPLSENIHVVGRKLFGSQLCIPKDLAPEDAVLEYERLEPCGTTKAWSFNSELGEVPCAQDASRKHIVVDA